MTAVDMDTETVGDQWGTGEGWGTVGDSVGCCPPTECFPPGREATLTLRDFVQHVCVKFELFLLYAQSLHEIFLIIFV